MRRGVLAAATSVALALTVWPAQASSSAGPVGLHPGTSSFLAAPPLSGFVFTGPAWIPRPKCKPGQIKAAAFTESSPDGVLGVIELKGTKFYHRKPWGKLRCRLPISKGPRRFVAADGQTLDVPRGQTDTLNPASWSQLGFNALVSGTAALGFGWFGTYCGEAPRYVIVRLTGDRGTLQIPYDGPVPPCPADSSTPVASTLTDGALGWPNAPVQPAPPSYLHLATSAAFTEAPTRDAPGQVEVTISSDQPVVLKPCPIFGVLTSVRNANGRGSSASAVLDNRTPGCKTTAVTVTPEQPVTFALTRDELSPGTTFDAPKGSTFEVDVELAGMPTATTSGTVE